MKKKEKYSVCILIIILLLIDQITKIIAIKQGWMIRKTDTNGNGQYILTSIIIVLVIIRYIFNNNSFIKIYTRSILSFGISGGIGNLIDRIWNKSVILFINFNNIELNISYIYILIAWIGMAVILTKDSIKFLQDKKNKRNDKKNENNSK